MLIAAYIILLAIPLTLRIRNIRVFRYRIKLLDAVHKKNLEDIDKGGKRIPYITHRWEYLETVSYDRMVLMFWKPLDSFYDPKFLEEVR